MIRATFPPGSVTGAPKVRALEIIEELEPVRRGPYCGAVGGSARRGDLELSVAIRTIVAARGALHLHVGGAVTADSDPAGEWRSRCTRRLACCAPRAARRGGPRGTAARFVKIWLNGALAEEGEACIAPSDHGFLVGDGVFETLRWYDGRPFALGEHLSRLSDGCAPLGITAPDRAALEQAAHAVLAANGLGDARMRITVTSGPGPPAWHAAPGRRPCW